MEKMNTLINDLFPNLEIKLSKPITENRKVIYTYIDIIEGIDFKISFQENSLNTASILLACEYEDEQKLIELTDVLAYMKEQIAFIDNDESMRKFQEALKEDGIEMSQNFTIDLVVGRGSKIKSIV
jgi:hypothetical protein